MKPINMFIILTLIIMLLLTGCTITEKRQDFPTEKPVTLTEIDKLLTNSGFKKSKENLIMINGIKPVVYQYDTDKVAVYYFKSFQERKLAMENFKSEEYKKPAMGFLAKNAFLVYLMDETKPNEAGLLELKKVVDKVNDLKTIHFTGKNNKWDCTFTVKYYQHFWQSPSSGKIEYDSYNSLELLVNPLIPLSNESLIKYRYEINGGGGSGVIHHPGKTTMIGGGTGAYPKEGSVIKLWLNADGKEEYLELR